MITDCKKAKKTIFSPASLEFAEGAEIDDFFATDKTGSRLQRDDLPPP